MTAGAEPPLKFLHVLRAPVGGLFRHVADLARGQAARGHRVGLIADATTGGVHGEAMLAELQPELALGLARVAMGRQIGLGDVQATALVAKRAAELQVDVLHGHGAKGGAYARLAGARNLIRVYTPHGGSLHYRWNSPTGLLYLTLERLLMRRTDLFLFESAYGRTAFIAKIGRPEPSRVVHNGVSPEEFEPVAPDERAADLLFIGELRLLKGVDVLIDSIASLTRSGHPVTATIVGEGPDRAAFEDATRARRRRHIRRRHAGTRRLRAGPPPGRSLARGIAALHRSGSCRCRFADGSDACRGGSGDLRRRHRRTCSAG
jgi:glycosyltransferase involved in cell wall biosynthesis